MTKLKLTIVAVFAICLVGFSSAAITAQTVSFQLEGLGGSGLLPGNHVHNANSPGFGDSNSILFNTITNELSLDFAWGSANGFGDLTGNATNIHLHGPADFNNTGGVLVNLTNVTGSDLSASSGGFDATVTIATTNVQDLLDGNTYLNIHTAANMPGELRANLVAVSVPEPSSLAIIGLVGGVCALRRRRS